MINKRLFEHYGINTNKHLDIGPVCARPFDTVLIDKQGSCYACECQAWLPQSIGNLQTKSLEEILSSTLRTHLQESVSDGSYRYCNNKQCAYLKSQRIDEGQGHRVRYIRLAIDDSCNLRCPSCRDSLIFHKSGPQYNKAIRLADNVNEWLEQQRDPISVHMGSDGDPYASHVYRHFMANTPHKENIRYWIMTNGLLFRDAHTQSPHVTESLDQLAVSIDGATAPTYEKLRLGGNWSKLSENLQVMSDLKQEHGFRFHWHMVVQNDNWREIPLMAELAEKHGVDRMFFNPIQDWNTGLDHKQQDYRHKEEFVSLISGVLKSSKISRAWQLT